MNGECIHTHKKTEYVSTRMANTDLYTKHRVLIYQHKVCIYVNGEYTYQDSLGLYMNGQYIPSFTYADHDN